MAYRDFKGTDLKEKFGIVNAQSKLFPDIKHVEPSSLLVQILTRNRQSTSLRTEKAVSEALVSPILMEVLERNQKKITLFSGENLVADKSLGLNGELDFLFLKAPYALDITAPIINITEAKLDRALIKAMNQCAAQMIGAQLFNKTHHYEHDIIYGAVTDGYEWRFVRLEDKTLTLDEDQYNSANLPQLLGVLQTIVDFYH
jgi:hypothetical protein